MAEQDELLDSDYDGIQEYDNDLPRWWVWLFVLTVVFGVVYVGYLHFGPGLDQHERLEIAMAALESRSRLAALISRGPVVLGMLGVAVLLGAGAYMFVELNELPRRDSLFPDQVDVVTEPGKVATLGATEDIFVLIKFPGTAAVWIDGTEVGTWQDQVRLALAAGSHTLEVRFDSGPVTREVVLLPETSPVFEFTPSERSAP